MILDIVYYIKTSETVAPLKTASFSEKEAKTKAPVLSFGHMVDIIIKATPLFYKNRGVPPPPNSELKISFRNIATPCWL